MIKKIITLIITILFLGTCITPGLSKVKQNLIQSNYYNKETNDDILPPEELWNKTFEGYGKGNYIRETSGYGYKIISNIYDETYKNLVIAFIKTDKDANIESKKVINLFENDDMNIVSLIETSDEGYLFAGRYGQYGGDVIWDNGIFLLKTDENGTEEWDFKYDFNNYMSYVTIKMVSECPDGAFIISGTIEDFDDDDYDDGILLLKFNKYGFKEWNIRITHGEEELKCISPTDDGGCLLGGYISKDTWIRKLNKRGYMEWETVFEEGDGYIKEYASYIHPASNKGYIIVVASNSDYFRIIKIDDLGNEISNKRFDEGYIFSIQKTDNDGFNVFSKKSKDVQLIKFNTTGSYEYLGSFIYNGSSSDKIIRRTSDDGYILISNFKNYMGYPIGFYLAKLDSLGYKIWEHIYYMGFIGAKIQEFYYCRDINETGDGGYIICGSHVIYDWYEWEFGWLKVWVIKLGENNPPSIPIIEGLNEGIINKNYTYYASSTDPENDKISYLFDWDDKTNSNWTKYYLSGIIVNFTHNWTKQGTYNIKVKAKDEHGYESGWTSLKLTIPKTYIHNPFIEILTKIVKFFPFFIKILKQIPKETFNI